MDEHVMVHKANSIAQFFAAYPREEAIEGVAGHLQRFWEPRMRRQLLQYIAGGGAGLHELVLEAALRPNVSSGIPT
jgi:formate dehydrogenase subunit delta